MIDEPAESSTARETSSGDLTTPGSHRKERGAIAAQACDTCRNRKQKCDEQRPKCSTCQRFKLNCNYREPQPTKKDRTLLEILDRIKGLENKLDGLTTRASFSAATYHPMPNHVSTNATSLTMSPGIIDPLSATQFPTADPRSLDSSMSGGDDQYIYASSATQMMGWPVMQHLLEPIKDIVPGLNPATVDQDGPRIVLGIHEHNQRMPLSADGSEGQMKTIGPLAMSAPGGMPVTLDTLTWETMQRLSKAYFDSLNFLFPLVDRRVFTTEIIPSLAPGGFDESVSATIALLVFALGELVISGSHGIPIRLYNGRPSGVKGGTASEPPGLALFNEARKRMGFNLTECSIGNVQIFALAGIYYGACGHNTEQWRMLTSASLAVQALISSKPSELRSPRGDLIRRNFWHIMMMETCVILELSMPTTGLEELERVIGLPDFSESVAQEDYEGNQSTHFQEHFASQIVLRRMMIEFHNTMSQEPATPSPPPADSTPYSSASQLSTKSNATNAATIRNLAQQLDQWRGMLPIPLRWEEDSPGAFPAADPAQEVYHTAVFPQSPTTAAHPPPSPSPSSTHHPSTSTPPLMFTTDLDTPPNLYPFAYDIQVALLRTRYYYAKYLLHRPFLYKALHYPESMTSDDAAGVAACLKAALKWPVTMSPTCTRKRLIPCLYFWTQNVLGVLLVLHLATTDAMLQRIIKGGLCGETWEVDASETVGLYIDWLRDLKAADPAAGFGWEIVRAVYGLESD
ncbi:hypothetical protein CONLIGDRAFT_567738 [Coniochaeta ligniaria NRRL 30616]|uniref:Zn(2)-C6 fungal-type domain-containing protein n=1 Tax=Coniochaeta ligniaria NRRL 30616 TaxID=1408157 RepID=A0A1J7JZR2_9PEZI|nr:hypothetical protein CONLIGDRAFT_567738 [Coniochaeta ligniaria NRRL 30616]